MVEVQHNGSWVEIPTNRVEAHVTKGEVVDKKRSAKIEYPNEWGGRSVREVVLSGIEDGFKLARVYFDYPAADGWILTHQGWVGNNGSEEDGLSSFWAYDPAVLFENMFVSIPFNDPTLKQAIDDIVNLIDEQIGGAIDIADAFVVAEDFDRINDKDSDEFSQTLLENPGSAPGARQRAVEKVKYDGKKIDTGGFFGLGGKQFTANRHTIKDVLKWLREKAGANIHFETRYDGAGSPTDEFIIVVDSNPTRKYFAQDAAILNDAVDFQIYDRAHVIENTALQKIGSINTVSVRGETGTQATQNNQQGARARLRDQGFGPTGDTSPPPDKFPYVKVRHDGLYQAATDTQFGPQNIEISASTTDQAERVAKRKLLDKIAAETSTSGKIELYGNPFIEPYDRLTAYETCIDRVELNEAPVDYEIAEVVHEKDALDVYRTHVRVNLYADQSDITTVEKKYMEQ